MRRRILLRKRPWMVIGALIISLALFANPVMGMAEETVVIMSSEGDTIVLDEGTTDYSGATGTGTLADEKTNPISDGEIIHDEDIWKLIDMEELRGLVNVDEIKEGIDRNLIREGIDDTELAGTIDTDALLLENGFDDETLKAQLDELKEASQFESWIMEKRKLYPEVEGILTSSENAETVEAVLDNIDDEKDDAPDSEETKALFPIDEHPLDVVNVQLPILPETGGSIFDFLIDPMGLVYATDAAKYGGGRVEEGANILFRNSDSDYLFSSRSDTLSIVNKSNVPVMLTVIAKVENNGSAELADSMSMLYGDSTNMFMALADEDGISSIITENGEARVSVVLDAAPDDSYTYTLNEETGEYQYKLSEEADVSSFDGYEFWVVADCNSEADWSNVNEKPILSVLWKTEPILTDWDAVNAQLEAAAKAEFELYKAYIVAELKADALNKLIEARIDEIVDEVVNDLVEDKVKELAEERYNELLALSKEENLELVESKEDTDKSEKATTEVTVSEDEAKEQDEDEVIIIEESNEADESATSVTTASTSETIIIESTEGASLDSSTEADTIIIEPSSGSSSDQASDAASEGLGQ